MSAEIREFAWWHVGYQWFRLRVWWHGLPNRIAWRCAWLLPRQVALFAFVRVYSTLGDIGPDYEPVYKAWERGEGR